MSGQPPAVPTLFDWMGGLAMFTRLTETFYARVPQDPVLAPVFRDMPAEHRAHVALFVAEEHARPRSSSRTDAEMGMGCSRRALAGAEVSDRRPRVSVHPYLSRQILP